MSDPEIIDLTSDNCDENTSIEHDLKISQLCEMFPSLNDDILSDLLASCNLETTSMPELVNKCLSLSNELDTNANENVTNENEHGENKAEAMVSLWPAFSSSSESELNSDTTNTVYTEDEIDLKHNIEENQRNANQRNVIKMSKKHADVQNEIFQDFRRSLIEFLANNSLEYQQLLILRFLKALCKILTKVLKQPDQIKFRRIKTTSSMFQSLSAELSNCTILFESLHFRYEVDDLISTDSSSAAAAAATTTNNNNQNNQEKVTLALKINPEVDLNLKSAIQYSVSLLSDILTINSENQNNIHVDNNNSNNNSSNNGSKKSIIIPSLKSSADSSWRHQEEYIRNSKRKRKSKLNPNQPRRKRLTPSEMAAIVSKRLSQSDNKSNNNSNNNNNSGITKGRVTDYKKLAKIRKEIASIRRDRHTRWRNTKTGRKRIFTIADLAKMEQDRMSIAANFSTNRTSAELEKIGRKALEYTNQFRAEHKLPLLKWHSTLHDIGYEHSVNMGEGKSSFSHDGFNDRIKRYGFHHQGAAENLAMNHNCGPDVAKIAVDGWIDSPGHRKNLLSNMTYCGIGVYKNSKGQYYLTQLFAKV